MKKTLLVLSMFIVSNSYADERKQYSVTGKASSVNAFYHEMIECRIAKNDAITKADDLCFRKGFRSYTRAKSEGCKNRWFGGKKVKLKFYCY